MNVLSLFDGISCDRLALEDAGIAVNKYYASEVDKYAITVAQANYPDNIQLGDVLNWREWEIDWSSIDLLIGGSPCQGFSFAGKQLAFDDPRSALFFVWLDILEHLKLQNPNVKFLLENVKMKKEYLNVISEKLGVEPVFINSALVSAQNRQRYYWANWKFEQPKDKRLLLCDIIEEGIVDRQKDFCLDANYFKGGNLKSYFVHFVGRGNNPAGPRALDGKVPSLTANSWEQNNFLAQLEGDGDFINLDESKYSKRCKQQIKKNSKLPYQKGVAVCANANMTGSGVNVLTYDNIYFRKLTPIECERLQTVPDNYTNHVSNTQRYKMLGNGWTVDVIAHIFKQLDVSGEKK